MENNIFTTPVLFLIFNRLDTTTVVFEQIKQAKPQKLYIASDGARNHKLDENQLVKDTREYVINNIDWNCEVYTLFREENLGCKNAVSSALEWFFEHEEMGIILEDDCVPNQSFFMFCQDLLTKYKDDMRIWHIGGYNLLDDTRDTNFSYDFTRFAFIWGWATWRNRFKYYNKNLSLEYQDFIQSNNLPIYHDYAFGDFIKNMLNSMKDVDTWDYQWFITCIINNGLSVIPKHSLIKNIGLDSGTHYTGKNQLSDPDYYISNQRQCTFPLRHPYIINSSYNIEQQVVIRKIYNNKLLKYKLSNYQLYRLIECMYTHIVKPVKTMIVKLKNRIK